MNIEYFTTCIFGFIALYDVCNIVDLSERILAIINAIYITSYSIECILKEDWYNTNIFYCLVSYFLQDIIVGIVFWKNYTKEKLILDFIHHSITIYGTYELLNYSDVLFRKCMIYSLLIEISTIFMHLGMISYNYIGSKLLIKINAILFLISFILLRIIMITYINIIFYMNSYEFIYVSLPFCILQYFYLYKFIKSAKQEFM